MSLFYYWLAWVHYLTFCFVSSFLSKHSYSACYYAASRALRSVWFIVLGTGWISTQWRIIKFHLFTSYLEMMIHLPLMVVLSSSQYNVLTFYFPEENKKHSHQTWSIAGRWNLHRVISIRFRSPGPTPDHPGPLFSMRSRMDRPRDYGSGALQCWAWHSGSISKLKPLAFRNALGEWMYVFIAYSNKTLLSIIILIPLLLTPFTPATISPPSRRTLPQT